MCRKGNVAPLEVVADNIRRILIAQRRSEIIKSHEESIISKAMVEGHARLYGDGERISTYKSVVKPSEENSEEDTVSTEVKDESAEDGAEAITDEATTTN